MLLKDKFKQFILRRTWMSVCTRWHGNPSNSWRHFQCRLIGYFQLKVANAKFMSERSYCNYSFLLVQSVHVNTWVTITTGIDTFFSKLFQTWQNIFFKVRSASHSKRTWTPPVQPVSVWKINKLLKDIVLYWTCTLFITLAVQLSNDSHM